MRQQKGCVSIDRNKWVCRWRENVSDGNGGTVRKLQFKILGEVTADHRRNKDRSTGKPRVPNDIQQLADDITGATNVGVNVLTTIKQFVNSVYLPEKKQALKTSSYETLVKRWHFYLMDRIGSCVLRDYQRKDAAQLWRDLQRGHPHISKQTFQNIRFSLRGMFETAKDYGLYTGENPATASLPPNLPGAKETQAYTIDEVLRLLSLLTANPMAQAIIALAFGSGCRKGEIAALDWPHYERNEEGAIMHVRQSSWRGKVITTKTQSSRDDVAIDAEVCKYVDAYRVLIGNPTEGPMFHNHENIGNRINLDSLAYWTIRPLLERCGTCGQGKAAHTEHSDHKYQRNQTIPPWKGWHAFRRGNATFLAQQRTADGRIDGRAAATLMLRHANTSTTEDSYILESRQDRRAADAAKTLTVQRKRRQAAAVIGEGLRGVN